MKKVSYKICIFPNEADISTTSSSGHELLLKFDDLLKARVYCAKFVNQFFITEKTEDECLVIYTIEDDKILEKINRKNFRIFLPKNIKEFLEKDSEEYLEKEMVNKFIDTWKIGWFI